MANAAGFDVTGALDCKPTGCDALSNALFQRTGATGLECTTVVRMSTDVSKVIGYKVFCGPPANVDDASARAQATKDTGIDQGATIVDGPNPKDEYELSFSVPDLGQQAAVSARLMVSG